MKRQTCYIMGPERLSPWGNQELERRLAGVFLVANIDVLYAEVTSPLGIMGAFLALNHEQIRVKLVFPYPGYEETKPEIAYLLKNGVEAIYALSPREIISRCQYDHLLFIPAHF